MLRVELEPESNVPGQLSSLVRGTEKLFLLSCLYASGVFPSRSLFYHDSSSWININNKRFLSLVLSLGFEMSVHVHKMKWKYLSVKFQYPYETIVMYRLSNS